MSNQLKITNLQDTLYHFNAFMSDEQEVRACTIISSPLPSSTLAPLAYKSWPTPLYVFTLPYASNNYPQRRAYRQRGEGGDEREHGTERRSNRAVPPRADHKNKSKIKAKIARQSDRQRGRERKGKHAAVPYLLPSRLGWNNLSACGTAKREHYITLLHSHTFYSTHPNKPQASHSHTHNLHNSHPILFTASAHHHLALVVWQEGERDPLSTNFLGTPGLCVRWYIRGRER